MKHLKAFGAATVVFLAVDIAWIAVFVRDEYDAVLGPNLRSDPSVIAAVVFYVGYIAGIVYFAVRPALAQRRSATAAIHGALLGALAYGTYSLTNYAVFSAWSVKLVVTDIAWGAFLTALTATAGYFASRR